MRRLLAGLLAPAAVLLASCQLATTEPVVTGDGEVVKTTDGPKTPASSESPEGSEIPGADPEPSLPPLTDQQTEQEGISGEEAQEITGVRIGAHEEFDRVVLDLSGSQRRLGWFAHATDTATVDTTGEPMDLQGVTFLQVAVRGIDWTQASEERYLPSGPSIAQGTTVLTGVEFGALFEGQQQVVLGLREPAAYRIFSLDDPARLVIDLRHP